MTTFNEWFVTEHKENDLPVKEKMRLAWNAARLVAPEARAMAWIPVSQELPNHGAMVLISDGREIGMAKAERMAGHDDFVLWLGCGFGGYEWQWDFTPTHWMPIQVSLPQSNHPQEPK